MFIPPWSGQKCQPSAHNHKEKSWRIHPILHIECFCLLLPANSIEHCKIPRDFIVFVGFPRRPSVYCTSSTKSGKVLTLFPALRLFHETKHALVQGVLETVETEKTGSGWPRVPWLCGFFSNRLWWNVIRPGMTPIIHGVIRLLSPQKLLVNMLWKLSPTQPPIVAEWAEGLRGGLQKNHWISQHIFVHGDIDKSLWRSPSGDHFISESNASRVPRRVKQYMKRLILQRNHSIIRYIYITWDSNASFCKHAKQQVPKRDRILLIYTIPVWVHIESLNPPLGARCSICAWLTWIFNFDFRLSDCCCDFRFPHIYTFALPAKVNKNSWEMICKQRDAHGAFYCSRQVALLEAAAPFFIHCRAKSRSPSISASTCLNLSWLATLSVNPAMKIPYEDWSDIDTCLGRRL